MIQKHFGASQPSHLRRAIKTGISAFQDHTYLADCGYLYSSRPFVIDFLSPNSSLHICSSLTVTGCDLDVSIPRTLPSTDVQLLPKGAFDLPSVCRASLWDSFRMLQEQPAPSHVKASPNAQRPLHRDFCEIKQASLLCARRKNGAPGSECRKKSPDIILHLGQAFA